MRNVSIRSASVRSVGKSWAAVAAKLAGSLTRVLLAAVIGLAANNALAVVTSTFTGGVGGNWSDSTLWNAGIPVNAGDTAQQTDANLDSGTLLDENVVLGILSNTGRHIWTIYPDSTPHAITMNNSGLQAIIQSTSRGVLTVSPNISIGDAVNGLKIATSGDTNNCMVNINGSVTGAGDVFINNIAGDIAHGAWNGISLNGLLDNTGMVTINGSNAFSATVLMNIGTHVTKLSKTGVGPLNFGATYSLNATNGSTIGDSTNAMTLSLLNGGALSVTGGLSAISNKVTASLAGGELKYVGTGGTTTDTIAGITAAAATGGTGQGTVTIDASVSGSQTSLTAATWTAPTSGAVLFRGTSMGSTPGTGVGSIFFTTAPTLSGAGSAGTSTVGIMAHAYGNATADSTGAFGFVTYDSIKGVRLLDTGTEYATNSFATPNANVLINGVTPSSTATINSLLIASGGSVTGNTNALTITSGDILVTGANSGLAARIVMGTGTTTFTTVSDLTWSGNNNNTNTAANLVKNGPGTLTLSGLGSGSYYTGATTINGGEIDFNTGTGSKLVNLTVNNGGTAKMLTTGVFGTTGTFTINTGGFLDLNSNDLSTGALNGAGTVLNTGSVAKTFTINSATNSAFSGSIQGTNLNLTKGGTSTLTLSGSNSYTGNTTVSGAGILQVTQAASLPGYNISGKLSVTGSGTTLTIYPAATGQPGWTATQIDDLLSNNGGGFASGTILGINTSNGPPNFTYSTNITKLGSGVKLTKLGNNTLTLSGNNTYGGTILVNGGTLALTGTSTGNVVTNIGVENAAVVTLAVSVLANGLSNSSIGSSSNAATNLQLQNACTLQYIGAGDSTDRLFNMQFNTGSQGCAIDASGSGPIHFTNNTGSPKYGNSGGGQARTLTLTGTNTGANTMDILFTDNGTSGTSPVSITKKGIGQWVLTNANTYTGTTTVNAGTLVAANTQALGGATAPLALTGGTLDLATDTSITAYATTVSTAPSTILSDKKTASSVGITHTLGTLSIAGQSLTIAAGPNVNATLGTPAVAFGATTLSSTTGASTTFNPTTANLLLADVTSLANTTKTDILVLDGTATGNSVSGIISNSAAGTTALTKSNSSTWTLGGASTYTGKTTISGGILSVASINSVSGGIISSNLGAPTTAANGTLGIGSAANTGQLTYSGTGETTDRVISLAGAVGGATLDQSGAGTLKFTSNLTAPGVASTDQRKTLTLQGSSAGTGEIAGIIPDSVLGTAGQKSTSLTKTGAGTWTLSGGNTYTGATTVSDGTLKLGSGGSLGATAVSVTGTAKYGMAYASSGNTVQSGSSLDLASGTTLDLRDSNTNTLNFTGVGTLNGAALKFDLGTGGLSDRLSFGLYVFKSNTNAFSFTALDSSLSTGLQAYTLATGASGGLDTANFSVPSTISVGGVTYNLALSTDTPNNNLYLDVTASSGPTNSTWNVGANEEWTTGSNWLPATAPSGPGATANFTGKGSTTAVTVNVNAPQTVGRLLFNQADGTTPYSIGGADKGALTMDNTGGTGSKASITATAGSHVITSQVKTAAASDLDVSVSGGGSLDLSVGAGGRGIDNTAGKTVTLTQAGGGTLAVGNVNNVGTGLLDVAGGTVAANAISGTGSTSVGSTAAASLTADSIVQNTLTIGAGSTVTIRETTGGSVSSVPEPGTWVLIGTALMGWLAFRRRQRYR